VAIAFVRGKEGKRSTEDSRQGGARGGGVHWGAEPRVAADQGGG